MEKCLEMSRRQPTWTLEAVGHFLVREVPHSHEVKCTDANEVGGHCGKCRARVLFDCPETSFVSEEVGSSIETKQNKHCPTYLLWRDRDLARTADDNRQDQDLARRMAFRDLLTG